MYDMKALNAALEAANNDLKAAADNLQAARRAYLHAQIYDTHTPTAQRPQRAPNEQQTVELIYNLLSPTPLSAAKPPADDTESLE